MSTHYATQALDDFICNVSCEEYYDAERYELDFELDFEEADDQSLEPPVDPEDDEFGGAY
jgi:hypothetical protein